MKTLMYKKVYSSAKIVLLLILIIILITSAAYAAPFEFPIPFSENRQNVAVSLQILFLLTILSLAPAILIMMTSFTRIIIILSFLRNALGTQQMPPNQVLIGLALFLTFFIMAPIGNQINNEAIQPYINNEIGPQTALEKAGQPLREFMLKIPGKKTLHCLFHYQK